MVTNGKFYILANGQSVRIDETINPLKFISRDEFQKGSSNMMSKYLVHLCCLDRISGKMTDIYFINNKNK